MRLPASICAAAVFDRHADNPAPTFWNRSTGRCPFNQRGTSIPSARSGWPRAIHAGPTTVRPAPAISASDFWMRDENGGALPRLRGQTTLIVSDPTPRTLSSSPASWPSTAAARECRHSEERCEGTEHHRGRQWRRYRRSVFSFNRNPSLLFRSIAIPNSIGPRSNFLRAIAHRIRQQGNINLCFHWGGPPF